MTPESRTRMVTVAEVGVLVAVLVVGLLVGWHFARKAPGAPDLGSNEPSTSTTRSDVDMGTHVPEAGEAVGSDVAAPSLVVAAAPGVDARKRTFGITFDGKSFAPSNVIVHAGDTTSITFKTTSGTCGFSQPDMGLMATFTTAKDQLIEVTPPVTQVGKFAFFCTNLGGPDSGPVGYLTVVPK